MECMLRRVRKGTVFHQHKWTWAIDRSECHVLHGVLWRTVLSAPRKKDGESGTKTQNRQRFLWCWGYWIGYDAKTAKNSFRGIQSRIRSMSGVITMIKGITFPSFAWKKCFSPRKVSGRIEETFFTGDCIVASRQSCGPAEKMTPRCA